MRKRNLSEFMCIEMLYDYKSGKLDPLRNQAVEEGLQASPRVREELKKLTIGISYCDKLKNVSISEPLVDLILDQPKPSEKILSRLRWSGLPQPVRWALEAVVVAVAIALFVTQVPDLFKGEKTQSQSMVVKKFDIKPPGPEVVAETDVSGEETPPTMVVATKEIPMLLRPPTEPIVKPVAPTEPAKTTPVATTIATTTPTTVAATTTTSPTTVTAQAPVEIKPKKGNAYVYRMTMYVDDVDHVTPEIVTLISGLGGEKAGEVELGWRRKGGSYFHFSVPQANSPALQDGLRKYAQFQIVKSAHPRVMPEGTERYILWVEKKNAGGSGAPMEGAEENVAPETAPAEPTQGTSEVDEAN